MSALFAADMDIADVNWKTQHVPPFEPSTKGVLLHYLPYGVQRLTTPA